ncbi:carbohydrate ABC transporter permease [Thermogemmatispora sp.]|uniref:carbohydrate ABC transporter permease n=1 Tax=Thermogemmatispora sp. TaxID=1968838 RepID=UPI00260D435C|nr:carbohydrate ABC transporter permease [Thermogemmatispora sp.]
MMRSDVAARSSRPAPAPVFTRVARWSPRSRSQRQPRRRRLSWLWRLPVRLLLLLLLTIEIYPLIWLLLSSFKEDAEFSLRPLWALPAGLHWQNYVEAWTTGNIGLYFLNSVLTVFPALALILALSVPAGFALEVMRWRGRNLVLLLFLAGIMVPLQILLLPLFTIYFHLDLIDTRWALIITYTGFGLPLTVFLMAGYFKAIPRELLEAAILDGAGLVQLFLRVAVPLVSNGLVTVALVQFFFLWNDLLFSLTFISNDQLRTIQTGLLNFTGQYGQVAWGPTFAAVSLAVFPTLLLYLLLNQRVIKGLTAGALKG